MDRIVVAMRSGLELFDRNGDGWTRRRVVPAPDLDCVALHPDAPDRIFVGSFGDGIYRSEDGGETFAAVGEAGMEPNVMSLAVDPSDPETVYAGTEPSRLYRSTDAGESWRRVEGLTAVDSATEWSFPPRPHTHHVRWIEIDPNDPDRWYVGIEAGALLVTTDAGESWIDRPAGSRLDNHTLATHPADPGRVYSAAGDGYAESTDRAESWDHPQEGLEHRYVWGLAVDPGDPDVRLVSAAHGAGAAHRMPTADNHVYRRIGEQPWDRLADRGLPMGEGVLRAAIAGGSTDGQFVAANNHGVYLTHDAGESWERLTGDRWDRYAEDTVRGIVTG